MEAIEAREQELLNRTFDRWKDNANLEILGNPDPEKRISIISFNVKDHHGRYLHPKFVTTLLNDLFGIQSRAGCSCAGPYGHRLLEIDHDTSERYRDWIRKGYCGIKPGWCRISLHYVMDELEVDYILDAIDFVAEHGFRFLPRYDFDVHSGAWQHKEDGVSLETFSIDAALECPGYQSRGLTTSERELLYRSFLAEAERLAVLLEAAGEPEECTFDEEFDELRFFPVPEASTQH